MTNDNDKLQRLISDCDKTKRDYDIRHMECTATDGDFWDYVVRACELADFCIANRDTLTPDAAVIFGAEPDGYVIHLASVPCGYNMAMTTTPQPGIEYSTCRRCFPDNRPVANEIFTVTAAPNADDRAEL